MKIKKRTYHSCYQKGDSTVQPLRKGPCSKNMVAAGERPESGKNVTQSKSVLTDRKNLRTTLSPLEEEIVVELRKSLFLPLDDLLVIVREFIQPAMSRSALDRCLRRHGVSRLADLIPRGDEEQDSNPAKAFKEYQPGVFMEIRASKSAGSVRAFLKNLIKKGSSLISGKIVNRNSDKV